MISPTALIIRPLNTPEGPVNIRQRTADGYVCVTDICQAAGKLYADWRRQERAEEYLHELSLAMGIPISKLLISSKAVRGNPEEKGTWGHPRIALRVAQWCSPRFEVQVDTWLEEWLSGKRQTDEAVNRILELYMTPKPGSWEKRFEREFFYHLYRLWNKLDKLPPEGNTQYEPWVSEQIKNIIYDRHFPPVVMTRIREVNPLKEGHGKGRARKHMQHLTKDLGDLQQRQAIFASLSLMRVAQSKAHLFYLLDMTYPKHGTQAALPFFGNVNYERTA